LLTTVSFKTTLANFDAEQICYDLLVVIANAFILTMVQLRDWNCRIVVSGSYLMLFFFLNVYWLFRGGALTGLSPGTTFSHGHYVATRFHRIQTKQIYLWKNSLQNYI